MSLKVLEVGGAAAGYAGRLFAHLGAAVTRVEVAQTGHRSAASGYEAAVSAYLHGGKHKVPLDQVADWASFAADFDIAVADCCTAELESMAFAHWPVKVRAAITAFGTTGPYRHWQAQSATLLAMGGYTYLMGDVGREPLTMPGLYAEYQSGQMAYIGALATQLAIEQGRLAPGRNLDISKLETVLSLSQFTTVMWTFSGKIRSRHGNDWENLYPISLFPCKDGYVVFNVVPNFWLPFTKLLDRPDFVTDSRFNTNDARMANCDALRVLINEHVARFTMAELLELGQQVCRVPTGPVMDIDAVLNDPHLQSRGIWEVTDEGLRIPKVPFRVVEQRDLPDPSKAPAGQATPQQPLEGVRIADFTHVWAGPLATRILADLGATTIKIEAPLARGPADIGMTTAGIYPRNELGEEPWNRQGFFNKLNRNKQSLVVDLKQPEGYALVCDLIRSVDLVVDNFTARAMGSMGFSFEQVQQLNSGALCLSMPGFGVSGPYKEFVAFGPSVEPMSGLTSLMGYSQQEPRLTSIALPDAIAGVTGAAAAVTALYDRWRRQQTCFVELALHEGAIAMIGEYFAWRQLSGKPPQRLGNTHPSFAPNGIYRCAPAAGDLTNELARFADDQWISISCCSDDEFETLAFVLGFDAEPWRSLAARFADAQGLKVVIENKTGAWQKNELMAALQRHGVAAGSLMVTPEMLADPQLRARGFFVSLGGDHIETMPYPGSPLLFDGGRDESWQIAPKYGEHNASLARFLGRCAEEIAELQAKGVLLSRPPNAAVAVNQGETKP